MAILAWREIGNISLTKNWQYTLPTEGSYFRISHIIGDPVPGTLRAAIGQSIEGIVFDRRLVGYKSGTEEGQFFAKSDDFDRRIAIQRLDDFVIGWIVKIEELIDLATQLPLSIDDIENLRLELNAKAAVDDLTALAATTTTALGGKAPISHQHQIADVENLAIALDTKAIASEVVSGLADKSPVGHGHGIGDVTGLETSLGEKAIAGNMPEAGATPPASPINGKIWHELDTNGSHVETWIRFNNRWQSLAIYPLNFTFSGSTFAGGSFSNNASLIGTHDYLFIDATVACRYNGTPDANNFYKTQLFLSSPTTDVLIYDSQPMTASPNKITTAINQVFSIAIDQVFQHRVVRQGNAPGALIGTAFRYRIIRK